VLCDGPGYFIVNCEVVVCRHGFLIYMLKLSYFTYVDGNVENDRLHSCAIVVVLR
jgi:hypothetical protein